jgi:glutamate dehydrogenase (NADP+)
LTYGGSKVRQDAAGFGAVYFLARMMELMAILWQENALWFQDSELGLGACRKSAELGAKSYNVVRPDGYIYDAKASRTNESSIS